VDFTKHFSGLGSAASPFVCMYVCMLAQFKQCDLWPR